jgi:hypothetical protein
VQRRMANLGILAWLDKVAGPCGAQMLSPATLAGHKIYFFFFFLFFFNDFVHVRRKKKKKKKKRCCDASGPGPPVRA